VFEVGQLIENQYLILEVRRGRWWIVYVAQDTISERVFIIKRPAESPFANAFDAATFMKSARAWIELGECEEITPAYLLKNFGGVPHLFIEYVRGPSLADILALRPGKPLPTDQLIAVMTELTAGMKFLHRATFPSSGKTIIHGNLHPGNILTYSGNIKITDIGIARAFRFPAGRSHADFRVERMTYMAHEDFENQDSQHPVSDIYSFGAVMYEIATGTAPQSPHLSNKDSYPAFGSDIVPPTRKNPQCPQWLEEAILKCITRNPENRFQSFEQIESLLEEMTREGGDSRDDDEDGATTRGRSRVARVRGIAKKESSRLNHYYLGVEHLMLGLLAEETSMVMNTVGDRVSAEKLRTEMLMKLPKGEGPWRWAGIRKTPRYKKVMKLARRLQHTYYDERMLPQHILLAILKEGQSVPARILKRLQIDIKEASERLQGELTRRPPSILVSDFDSPVARYTNRIVCPLERPSFIPFSSRQRQLKSARETLLRDKYSIIVVGEPGVGKTAFIRELACAVAERATDIGMDYGGIYRLRMPVLLADAEDEAYLVDSFRSILNEIAESRAILIIEDLPVLVCQCVNVPLQMTKLLDEYASSTKLLLVATATPQGRSVCEAERGNLMQFLEIITLQEPSEQETLEMLKETRESFEREHSVTIEEGVFKVVLNLLDGLPSRRALPAGAFELLDCACMTARLRPDRGAARGSRIVVRPEHVQHVVNTTSRKEVPQPEPASGESSDPKRTRRAFYQSQGEDNP
jgi:serine/threonine protein kinase